MKLYIDRDRIYSSHWAFPKRRRLQGLLHIMLPCALIAVMLGVSGFSLWLIITDTDALRSLLIILGFLTVWVMTKGVKR